MMLQRTHPRTSLQGRRNLRRGYSMLELSVSLAIFLILASVVSMAVAQSMVTQSSVRTQRVVSAALETTLEGVSRSPYDALLSDTFTPPQLCDGEALNAGTRSRSCLTLSNRPYKVTYARTVGTDKLGGSTATAGHVDVTARVSLANGTRVEAVRRVTAPSFGYLAGSGVVRVTLGGEYEKLDGPLYLLTSGASPQVAASAQRAGNVVLLRAKADDCTAAAPCRLGLAPRGRIAESGTLALAVVGDALGKQGSVVLTKGGLVEAEARLYTKGSATIRLVAQSDTTNINGTNPVKGSVCLWARFAEGTVQRTVPLCNTGEDPAEVALVDYAPDPAKPTDRLPYPVDVPIRILVDHPSGTCQRADGMVGHTTSGWVAAAVCTSWTWGRPLEFGPTGTTSLSPFKDASLLLRSGQVGTYQAVWKGDQARPAAGYNAEPVWAKPRQAAGCAFDATCVVPGDAPEATECPGKHCLSVANAVPVLTSPVSGTYRVHTVSISSSSTTFKLTAQDHDGDPLTVKLVRAPGTGTLHHGIDSTAPQLVAGSTLATAAPSPYSTDLTYVTSGAAGQTKTDTFVISLDDGKGGVREVELGMYNSTQSWEIRPIPSTIAQGTTGTVKALVIGINGEIRVGGEVTFSGIPTGSTMATTTVTTDGQGIATGTVDVATTRVGTYNLTVTGKLNGRSGQTPLKVTPTAGALTLSATGGPQGGRGTIAAATTDRAGDPFPGVTVNLVALEGTVTAETASAAKVAKGLYPEYAGCVTDGAGRCDTALVVESGAAAGAYTVQARSGSFAQYAPVSVTSVVHALQAPDARIDQGGTGAVTVTVKDGAGAPMPNVEVNATTSDLKLTLTPATSTTGADGSTTIQVAVAPDHAAGRTSLTLTAGGVTRSLPITVVAVLGSLTAEPGVTLDQGRSTSTWVTAKDLAGNAMPGATVRFTVPSTSKLALTNASTSGADGRAATRLDAKLALAGTHTVTATSGGKAASFTVTVNAAPTKVAVEGSAASSGTSTFTVQVLDATGNPVTGATVKVRPPTSGLVFTQSSTTLDGTGRVTVTSEGTGAAKGTHSLVVEVGTGTVTGTLKVS